MASDRLEILRSLAQSAIERALGGAAGAVAPAPWLNEPGATFVTLTREGRLRGCVGSLEPHRSLREDVQQNACAAAFRDPRFPPLQRVEWAAVAIKVSELSPLQPMTFRDEADALSQLRPGTDGLVLEYGALRATFLPQVWDDLPDPGRFLSSLKQKAGLPPDFWGVGVRLQRYQVWG